MLREGDRSDHILILVRGMLEVFREEEGGTARTIDILRNGALLGEMAVLLNEPRSVSVRALRDSVMIRVEGECIESLFRHNAELTLQCARALAGRLKRRTNVTHCDIPVKTIAIVPHCAEAEFETFCRELKCAFKSPVEGVCFVTASSIWAQACARAGGEEHASGAVSEWFAENEASNRYVVCQCDRRPADWNGRMVQQADLVLHVVDADSQPPGRQPSCDFSGEPPSSPRLELVLLRRASTPPAGSSAWLESARYATHHHVALGNEENYKRLVRRLAGNAWGLVLSGGGARGLAHIGVIRAIIDSKLSIDMIGGTSMGAIIAAQYAAGRDIDQILADTRRAFVSGPRLWDLTLPYVSLHTGRSTNHMLRELFGDRQIEDLPINFFCISCNLTQATAVVHQRGPVWMWTRASCAIPGLVPPIPYRGDLLVDGAFLNNLPVDEIRRRVSGRVIAADVSMAIDLGGNDEFDFTDSWSGVTHLVRKLAKRPTLPSIIKILMRTAEIGSVRDARLAGSPADIYVHIPLEGISMTDFARVDQIIEAGYEYTTRHLAEWTHANTGRLLSALAATCRRRGMPCWNLALTDFIRCVGVDFRAVTIGRDGPHPLPPYGDPFS